MTPTTIHSVELIEFEEYHGDGILTVFPSDKTGVPFPIVRLFTITGVSVNATRANHAHRWCSQLHVCLSGRAEVCVRDGSEERKIPMSADGVGLLVPPLLWATFTFEGPSTVLAVFCDKAYDPADYILSWSEFLEIKRLSEKSK